VYDYAITQAGAPGSHQSATAVYGETHPTLREIVPVHSAAVHVIRPLVREREGERLCHHASRRTRQPPISHGGLRRNAPYLAGDRTRSQRSGTRYTSTSTGM
jgi:hypothetical protein